MVQKIEGVAGKDSNAGDDSRTESLDLLVMLELWMNEKLGIAGFHFLDPVQI